MWHHCHCLNSLLFSILLCFELSTSGIVLINISDIIKMFFFNFRMKNWRNDCYQNVIRLYVIFIFELNVTEVWFILIENLSLVKKEKHFIGNPCQFFFQEKGADPARLSDLKGFETQKPLLFGKNLDRHP